MAAIEAGLPVRRFKCTADALEIELGDTASATSTPQIVRTPTARDDEPPAHPYERLFRGQMPSFRPGE